MGEFDHLVNDVTTERLSTGMDGSEKNRSAGLHLTHIITRANLAR
jgi:hypothetical protein